jgi:hypothetical protein
MKRRYGTIRDAVEMSFRVTSSFFNSSLDVTFVANAFGLQAQNGSFFRLSADYDLADGWLLTGGLVFYERGRRNNFQSEIFRAYDPNDRAFLGIKYSF